MDQMERGACPACGSSTCNTSTTICEDCGGVFHLNFSTNEPDYHLHGDDRVAVVPYEDSGSSTE